MLETEGCTDYLKEVRQTAKAINMEDALEKQLNYLGNYACVTGDDDEGNEIVDESLTRCKLFKDFAPLSFAFHMEKKQPNGEYVFWFNGGLIFYQAGDSGVGMPTLSVRIGDTSKAEWRVHT